MKHRPSLPPEATRARRVHGPWPRRGPRPWPRARTTARRGDALQPLQTQASCLRLTAGGQTCALSTLHDDGAHPSILPAGDYELTLERDDERLEGLTLHIDAA